MNLAKLLRTPFSEDLCTTASEFVTEMLIFKSSHLQLFFKVSVLKNFAILEPLSSNKFADLLLQNTYGGCFLNFVAGNTFLQLNMVFIADSRTVSVLDSFKNTGQVSEAASETVLQKRCSEKICKFHRKTSVLKSLFSDSNTDAFLWNLRNF